MKIKNGAQIQDERQTFLSFKTCALIFFFKIQNGRKIQDFLEANPLNEML
jgi:hypothetical protein